MKKIQQTLEKKSRQPSSTVETQIAPTPRPWLENSAVSYRPRIITPSGSLIASTEDSPLSEQERVANAELICRAVNSHDALVEALWRAKEVIEHEDSCFTASIRPLVLNTLTRINSALVDAVNGDSDPSAPENHLAAPGKP